MDIPDLSTIEQISKGNNEFKGKLLTILKEELPVEIDQLESNIENKEWTLAAEDVHKLKHKISLLKMENDYKLAQAFETDLSKGNLKLHEDFMEIMKNITIFLNALNKQ